MISAGNVDVLEDDHLDRSDVEPIEDPAQAWNALTIGAYTDLDDVSSTAGFEDWTPLAPRGELSPHRRTGVAFQRTWPHKPDGFCAFQLASLNRAGRPFFRSGA
jgi:hypothetical protein